MAHEGLHHVDDRVLRRGLLGCAAGSLVATAIGGLAGCSKVPAPLPASSRAQTHSAPALPPPPDDLARLAGGLLVTGVSRREPGFRQSLRRLVRRGHVGGVIITDTSAVDPGALVGGLQRASAAGGNPALLIAVDQEGGRVRRLTHVGPRPSPGRLGAGRVPATRAAARGAGCALEGAGVTLDLAPVADLSSRRDGFIAQSGRSFGSTAMVAAPHVAAFVRGLSDGGVAATLKHFPGLGTAGASTDETLDERIRDPGAPRTFLAGIEAGAAAVMMSSATYAEGPFASALPAAFSAAPYRWLRRHGFRGPTITDAMSGDALRNDPRLPQPEVQALRAGVDILLFVDESGEEVRRARVRIVAAVRSGNLSRRRLEEAWGRVQELKAAQRAMAAAAVCQ